VKHTSNWRGKDIAYYLVFVAAAGFAVKYSSAAAIWFGGMAVLQLVEAVLHAFADAIQDAKEHA
jgi:hypothetical protein